MDTHGAELATHCLCAIHVLGQGMTRPTENIQSNDTQHVTSPTVTATNVARQRRQPLRRPQCPRGASPPPREHAPADRGLRVQYRPAPHCECSTDLHRVGLNDARQRRHSRARTAPRLHPPPSRRAASLLQTQTPTRQAPGPAHAIHHWSLARQHHSPADLASRRHDGVNQRRRRPGVRTAQCDGTPTGSSTTTGTARATTHARAPVRRPLRRQRRYQRRSGNHHTRVQTPST